MTGTGFGVGTLVALLLCRRGLRWYQTAGSKNVDVASTQSLHGIQ